MKKIWIVTELFHPDETAVAYIFTRIAEKFAEKYEVNVLAGPEFYDKDKVNFADKIRLNPKIKIIRHGSLDINKNNLLQRTFNLIFLSIKLSNGIKKCVKKNDIVLLATNPAPIIILTAILRYLKKFQLHILVHDVFPENTIPAKVFKSNKSNFYRILKIVFDKAYSQADHLIVLGSDMKELLLQKTKKSKQKNIISVITNWSEPSEIILKERSETMISELGLENKIVIQYAGNIGRVQALQEFLEAYKLSSNPEIHLLFFGTGALVPYINSFIQKHNLSNITIYGGYAREKQNEILNSCDISLVSLSHGMYGLGVPSKTYNILSAGKPIIYVGDENTEIFQLINSEQIGWSFNVNNTEALIDFLKSISFKELRHYQNIGKRARKLAEEKYDEKIVLNYFQEKMESVINQINSKQHA